ncbi:MAG: phosphoglucosamine mutase [Desulfomonile tiedjei]|uniref:Phosphoglucosamine mutase n=1 Tax=Desulfomonile tiedjei TaxID=2358 RepID=A0A9D6V3B5_9BACT|nr:phosphoglucosamine mutase [Desulfomonile tiedjei]
MKATLGLGRGGGDKSSELNSHRSVEHEKSLFGTDGVRGVANQEPMTAETALKLGRALAFVTQSASGQSTTRPKILIGKDTRLSGYMLETALSSGICSMGVDVLLVGPMPTPGVAFLTVSMRCDAGAVISASHNPFEDNGIKFFARDGFKLSDEMEIEIERLVEFNASDFRRPSPERIGKAFRIDDALGRYVVFCKNTLPKDMTLGGMQIAVDCANGAAYKAAPLVFEELGAHVTSLGVSPNGTNINKNCGSLHPGQLCDHVRRNGAQVGIALDGDADRVIFVDEKGDEVDGDQIMGLIAMEMMSRSELRKNTLVATVMSNIGLDIAMQEMGGSVVRTPVGDKHVVARMRSGGFSFGGEPSGHLIFLDEATTGDGIIAALQVLRIMVETGKPLSELTARLRMFPQVLRNVEVKQKRDLLEIPELRNVIREGEAKLKHRGRLLIRYSGTQPVCRIMAEGADANELESIVEMVSTAISRNL